MCSFSTLMGRNLSFTSAAVSIAPNTMSRTLDSTVRLMRVSCGWSHMLYGAVDWVVTHNHATYSMKSTFVCISCASLCGSGTMCSNITPPACKAYDLLWALAMKFLNPKTWAVVQSSKELECNRLRLSWQNQFVDGMSKFNSIRSKNLFDAESHVINRQEKTMPDVELKDAIYIYAKCSRLCSWLR